MKIIIKGLILTYEDCHFGLEWIPNLNSVFYFDVFPFSSAKEYGFIALSFKLNIKVCKIGWWTRASVILITTTSVDEHHVDIFLWVCKP